MGSVIGWGVPQWLVALYFANRAILGLACACGIVTIQQHSSPSKGIRYVSLRILDGIAIAILIWGGFWG